MTKSESRMKDETRILDDGRVLVFRLKLGYCTFIRYSDFVIRY